ncbi:MAG: mevalonate kinase, partial [Halodesulfurarchaeum sp.]
ATVTVEPRDDPRLRVQAQDLSLEGFTVEYDGSTRGTPEVDVTEELLEAAMGYVEGAIDQVRDVADTPEAGFDVQIESQIPLGAGLGSSAAVVVATIDAASRALDVELDRAEIADRAYRVEHAVQDGQASRADTYCSAMGGAVLVEGDDCRQIAAPDLPLVVGYDGGAGDTGALVSGVRSLRETYPFVADTVESIGDLVEEGIEALEAEDIEELGRLMDFNHGLLAALGVSSRSLDAMVWAARDAGAAGAKLTGAGGGGSIVALDETDAAETALEIAPACMEAFRAELDTDGVRAEQ